MSKTYILEPTKLTFNEGSNGIYVNTSEESPLLTSDLTGSLFSISDKQFMFCMKEPEDETMWIYYTPDGNEPENNYDASTDEFIEIEASAEYTNIYVAQAIGLSAGEHSVSVFKEDGDGDGDSGVKLTPITREEMYLDAIANSEAIDLQPITREEMYLDAIANGTNLPSGMNPITRKEMFLNSMVDSQKLNIDPITREEMYLDSIVNGTELPSDFIPITRQETLFQTIIENGGGQVEEGLVYKNDGDIVLKGSSLIDTGFAPKSGAFTIMCKWSSWSIYNGSTLFSLRCNSAGNNATVVRWMVANTSTYVGYSIGYSNVITDFAGDSVAVSMKPNEKPVWYYKTKSGALNKITKSNNHVVPTSDIWIGGNIKSDDGTSYENRATATITEFKCYNIVCEESKIREFLGI